VQDSPHLRVGQGRLDNGEGSIPKWALLSLAHVVQLILPAPNVGEKLKSRLFDSAVRCVRRLPSAGPVGAFRPLLVRALAGEAMYDGRNDYVELAWDIYAGLDHVLLMETRDLETALHAALPVSAPYVPPPPPAPTLGLRPTSFRRRWVKWLRELIR